MEIQMISVNDLVPYENNPRHNEDAVQYVKNSIAEFGFRVPIVIDKENVIVCGHTRYKAALELDMDTVPCIVADDLTEQQVNAFRLVDNKTQELAEWDWERIEQTLDDLFFVFLDTVEKLKPKIVIAENVVGIVQGNAKGYCNQIVKRFRELGYSLQIFHLNSGKMDVPQERERIFFIANNQGYKKLRLDFTYDAILFGTVRSEKGIETGGKVLKPLLDKAIKGDRKIADVYARYNHGKYKYFNIMILDDDLVAPTVTSGGEMYRLFDRKKCTDEDYRNLQTFPQDYDFCGNSAKYVCGMSVPPNMMANIATEVYNQWLAQ